MCFLLEVVVCSFWKHTWIAS